MARNALGLDPGFASIGYAVVEIGRHSDRVVALGVIRTEKSDAKRKVLATDDNVRRCQEIIRALKTLFDKMDPVVLCAESMSFPRNASAAAKVALTWGVITTLALTHTTQVPIIQCSPQELKKVVSGSKAASKTDVQDALLAKYSYLPSLLGKLPKGQHEHAYDALGAIEACGSSQALQIYRSMA